MEVRIWKNESRGTRARLRFQGEEIRNWNSRICLPLFGGENMESEREEEKWLNGRKRKEKNGENEGGKTVLNLSSLY